MEKQKQHHQTDGAGKANWTREAPSTISLPEKTQKVFPEEHSIAKIEAEIYYGIALPEEEGLGEGDIQKVFVHQTDCLAAMKKYRGSRFKAFRNYEDALKFSEAGAAVAASQRGTGEEGAVTPQPIINVEKPSPFRGPKSQDLVKFRKSIEKADLNYFSQCMEENPRYLVSSGDTPAILQEGFRYNALHVACRTNRPAFVEKVLSTVSRPEFFQRLYPDDSLDSATRRSAFLLDLYLNTPDKGFNDTPLHFASKHGNLECVRVLMSYLGCETARPNKYEHTAAEIAGSRMKESSKDIVESIRESMREQYYVPLLRDDDLCLLPQVGNPWSPQLDSPTSPPSEWFLTSSPHSVASASPISPSHKVRAMAGPMSHSQAEIFYRLLRSSTTTSTNGGSSVSTTPSPARLARGVRPASLRIIDPEKGLERAGRMLAIEQRVNWREYWGFLDCFVDLASEEGLAALEKHLKSKTQQLRREKDELDASNLAARLKEVEDEEEEDSSFASVSHTQHQEGMSGLSELSWLSQASGSPLAQLCRGLEALRLNASLSPQGDLSPTACSKFLSSLEQHLSPKCGDLHGCEEPQGSQGLAEQVSYVLKSVEVSAGRMSEALREVALDLQASVGASMGMNRTLRAKLQSEVACLRSVVARAVAELEMEGLNLGFVHPLLACQAVMALRHSAAPADIAAITQAMRRTVSHMDLVPLDSSDEEESNSRHFEAPQRKTRGDTHHLSCVLRCLDVAMQVATNPSGGITSPVVPQLGQCHCSWEKNDGPQITRKTSTEVTVPASALEKERVTAYLQKILQGSQRDPVVRHLSFTHEEGEEEEEMVVKATLGPKEGFKVSKGIVTFPGNREYGQEEQDPGAWSPDSFMSAASSLEEDMCTPEEGLKVFIGGAEATKTDVDALEAVGEQLVKERKYPHIFQWQLLVKSFSNEQRESWASPFCRRGRGTGGGTGRENVGSAPSKLSLQNTPHRPPYSRPAASTSRVLFRKL